MNEIGSTMLVVICIGISGAVGWRGHARALLWCGGTLLAVLAIFGMLHATIPFHLDRRTVLIVALGLAVAGVTDLMLQRLVKKWNS